ncbi:glycosyltransferase [Candidatus Parcubacteria bacterium]|nr:glycosyltransferase [Candidatus Parcubacteria bacterium]
MKICYIASANSIHSFRWIKYFAEKGHEIHWISLQKSEFEIPKNIKFYQLKQFRVKFFDIIFNAFPIRKLIKKIQPDILHAHYAGVNGILGALSGFHPFVLNIWGSDIFEVPRKSIFHKYLIKFTLEKTDFICSTSKIMKKEIQKYVNKEVLVTPFGVDCELFKPMPNLKPKNKIIIGTIKALEKKYGIDYLIRTFYLLVKKYPCFPLELHIGGKGSLKKRLRNLCKKLGIEKKVKFLGYIPHQKVPQIFNTFDVAVFLSLKESFGVAVLEAEACGVPVVVSNVGGLPEVVENNITGFIVPSKDEKSAADAIEKLIINPTLRKEMGINARKFVLESYEWYKNVQIMENLYKKIFVLNYERKE